jgi:hypothetical protein
MRITLLKPDAAYRPLGGDLYIFLKQDVYFENTNFATLMSKVKEEQTELPAGLTSAIRSDRTFWPTFKRCVDALQEKHEICGRG